MTEAIVAPVPQPAAEGERRTHYIRSHGALRGVAALLVVVYHLQFGVPYRLNIETATPFFMRGYLFVDLFFILSGFVISLSARLDERPSFDAKTTGAFYAARFARIYPLHLFCLLAIVISGAMVALVRHWHHGASGALFPAGAGGSFVAELLLVQAWIPGAPYWNIPSWSISAEFFAYMIFPILARGRARSPRLAMAGMMLLPLCFYIYIFNTTRNLDVITGLAILRCLSGFIIGMLIYDGRRIVAGWNDTTLIVAQLFSAIGIVVVLASHCPDPIVIPMFALMVASTWQDRGPVSAVLIRPFAERAGKLSYSIYLTHALLIGMIVPPWYAMVSRIVIHPVLARIGFIVASMLATIVVSRWTFSLIETGGRRWLLSTLIGRAMHDQ